VILATHDFGGHISRRTRGVLRVVLSPDSGDAKVCDSHITIDVNNEVLRLDVPVNNILIVEIFEARDEASHKESRRLFVESAMTADVVTEVTTREVVHD